MIVSAPVGDTAHAQGTQRLVDSWQALPAGAPVRLAKTTSNLFRHRDRAGTPGLDTTGLRRVVDVDPAARTADVQGMCTYGDLVDVTLAHDLVPLVVPQLRTITLGGAVTGLGIESTSFRHGLPHESVLEMDVLTGAGQVVTARPDGDDAELFAAFPNSYGTLGYATRLRIELAPTAPYVSLRHRRFDDLDRLCDAVRRLSADGHLDGEPVDFCDGMVLGEREAYLTLGRWAHDVPATSGYTGRDVYWRSVRDRGLDALTTWDYLWRWDTDWFWCSRAFGAQHPAVRALWPARYRRSDVYHRLVSLERRLGAVDRLDRLRGRPSRERVVQDVELPVERTADFLRWFLAEVPMTPLWVCPLRLREPGGPGTAREWPLYPLRAGHTYVNVGFWGTVPSAPGAADGAVNRRIEAAVGERDGHKSLYSDAYYDRATFDHLYGGAAYRAAKRRYDPGGRLPELYDKAVRRA